jgi:hypothetical protein
MSDAFLNISVSPQEHARRGAVSPFNADLARCGVNRLEIGDIIFVIAGTANVDFVIAVAVVIILFVAIAMVEDRLIGATRRLSLFPLAITSTAAAWWWWDNKQVVKPRNRGKT